MTAPTTIPLSDGSACVIEPTGPSSSLISRVVYGECVWGQAFGTGSDPDRGLTAVEAHAAQVRDVVTRVGSDPSAFTRWWLS